MKIISNIIEAHIFRVVNKKMQFLILRRSNEFSYPFVWQMVTGRNEKGEKAVRTVIREIKEETGLTPKKMWVVPNLNFYFDHEQDGIILVPVFAVKVDKNADVKISNEHSKFKWVSFTKAKRLFAWSGQKKSIEIIFNYYTRKKNFLKLVEINSVK
ncbi:MAG: NUDIX pyrophosphatase [Ignavibacteriales bacterium]|nr:NUDIX pyrophosphatase [Ignavibacteriales bacterium]